MTLVTDTRRSARSDRTTPEPDAHTAVVRLGERLVEMAPHWAFSWPEGRYVAFTERSDDPRSGAVVRTSGGWAVQWANGSTDRVDADDVEPAAAVIAAHLAAAL